MPTLITQEVRDAALSSHVFYELYAEPNAQITAAAEVARKSADNRVATAQFADLTLDALSLASIFFLAAIGLAITFGVMGVINMAHGEFIMMGAYTGYVVQLFIPNYTVSIFVALPLAFAGHVCGWGRYGAACHSSPVSQTIGNIVGDLWCFDCFAAIG